ncbi:DEAD/DEAH box helicase [Macrococcoides canis]|uniref:DEAD/DEAH box helicase n=1 Tax=Macrococcoides canis TaxID=1855823 RepID=UPI00105F276A|nr:DEAD/DEAH box helicase [Macrococcus canis]TDM38628.1 DEAD/DEAH box helicase [Macrococcus canis]
MKSIEYYLKLREFKDFNENFYLIKNLSSNIDHSDSRKILIHILDIWDNVCDDAKEIWIHLIGRAGLYPYFIEKVNFDNDLCISPQTRIKTEFFKSDYLPNVYFHEQQKEIEQIFSDGGNVAVSAPTSFGKSLLIEEFVARKKFENILIIQPTLALIDETRKKLSKYKDYYNIIVNTHQNLNKNNIFILTAERVLEFSNIPKIDFFVIDEFYKISNRLNDDRIDSLNVALLKIMKHNPQSMFLTPTVNSLSEKFIERYNINFFKTDYNLVNTNVIEIRTKNSKVYKGNSKKEKLFKMLYKEQDSTIVYVSSPNEAYKLANEYIEYLKKHNFPIKNNELDIFEWIDENISPNWQLKKILKHGVGTHNGALPRHVITTELNLFNEKKLNVLFATVSLIEGVNTVAKNIYIFSDKKGRVDIDFFDFANIKGRAGRMNHHFTGNVYLFIDNITSEEFIIDIPIIDQINVSDEILINIPDDEVNEKDRKRELQKNLDIEIQEIIKKNLININGQKKLYQYINAEMDNLDYLRWEGIPSYDELWKTLELGYKFLMVEKSHLAKSYAITSLKFINLPLRTIINNQTEYYEKTGKKDPLNKAIDYILKFQRNKASFEIPKILSVIDSIQKYVFNSRNIKSGDYTTFLTLLESDTVDEKLQFLVDFGVPSSAVKKIDYIPTELSENKDIANYIKLNLKKINSSLIPYEKNLLKQALE